MYSNILYSIGSLLNVLVLCYCCKKWKTIGPIKFLVAVQAILSSLTILSSNSLLATESVDWFPKGKFLCYQLPSLVIFFLGLAIFNLTCLVCVKYAHITESWYLRRSSAIIIFMAVFGVSTLICSPGFYSINKGWSNIRFDGCMDNASNIGDTEVAKKVDHFNVVRYFFWFLVLQFILPAFIISSRLVLILIHYWQEELTTDTLPKPHNQVAIRCTVNVIYTILFVVTIVSISLNKSLDSMESNEALAFLNDIFQKFALSYLLVLGFPWYLVEMMRSKSANEKENSYLPSAW